MKRAILWIVMVALCTQVQGEESFHIFTDVTGRAINARIVAYDARNQIISMKMENGRQGKIPLAQLSEEDKKYVETWHRFSNFLDERKFLISGSKTEIDSGKDKVFGDLNYVGGDTVENFLMNVVKWEQIAFKLDFSNSNDMPIDGLRMEYKIYYEQSEMTADGIKPEPKSLVFDGSATVPMVPKKGKVSVTTQAVRIYEDDVNPRPILGGDPRQGGEGDVHGIRIKVFMKLNSGEEMEREFCYPSGLSDEKFPWK
jgi:hypothetical protein